VNIYEAQGFSSFGAGGTFKHLLDLPPDISGLQGLLDAFNATQAHASQLRLQPLMEENN
jgi:hypothetical protein